MSERAYHEDLRPLFPDGVFVEINGLKSFILEYSRYNGEAGDGVEGVVRDVEGL